MRRTKDFRPQLLSMARYYAKEEAKHRIRARGEKVSRYAAKDITRMAMELLMKEPEPFVARARKVLAAEIERQLLRTFAQNSQVKCSAEVRS
jgi:hypothetical protein